MEYHLAGRKEPELVQDVENYQLEIVRVTSRHSMGYRIQLLERGWSLHYSGVAQEQWQWAGVSLGIAPQLSYHVLEFEGHFPVLSGRRLIGCVYGPNSSTVYPAFLKL